MRHLEIGSPSQSGLHDLDLPADGLPVVLHVEDDRATQKLVRRAVRRTERPFHVVTTGDVDEAFRVAHQVLPAVILLDLHVGGASGCDLLEQLRADASTAITPIVVLSGDARPERIDEAMAAGATAYLTKPVDVWELLRVVEELAAWPAIYRIAS
jgi:CheY-like chemotaxis protein